MSAEEDTKPFLGDERERDTVRPTGPASWKFYAIVTLVVLLSPVLFALIVGWALLGMLFTIHPYMLTVAGIMGVWIIFILTGYTAEGVEPQAFFDRDFGFPYDSSLSGACRGPARAARPPQRPPDTEAIKVDTRICCTHTRARARAIPQRAAAARPAADVAVHASHPAVADAAIMTTLAMAIMVWSTVLTRNTRGWCAVPAYFFGLAYNISKMASRASWQYAATGTRACTAARPAPPRSRVDAAGRSTDQSIGVRARARLRRSHSRPVALSRRQSCSTCSRSPC